MMPDPLSEQECQAKEAAWRTENAEAIAAYNALVVQEGLPLEPFRTF